MVSSEPEAAHLPILQHRRRRPSTRAFVSTKPCRAWQCGAVPTKCVRTRYSTDLPEMSKRLCRLHRPTSLTQLCLRVWRSRDSARVLPTMTMSELSLPNREQFTDYVARILAEEMAELRLIGRLLVEIRCEACVID